MRKMNSVDKGSKTHKALLTVGHLGSPVVFRAIVWPGPEAC